MTITEEPVQTPKLGDRVAVEYMNMQEGDLIQIVRYLNGSSHYVIRYLDDKGEPKTIRAHAPELTVITPAEDKPEAVVKDGMGLGSWVTSALDPEIKGVVTAHHFSDSGCIEYEVTMNHKKRGVCRLLLEGELLTPIENPNVESVPVGKSGGSHSGRDTYVSR